ncbi:RHS repeat domain-containing protein [Aquimarina spongiae]|uniref:RHS repeat-associated core domain-containing protein n=1 Tax=Aquimarina spongiae TaxID=570521 RepID=A0A1M6EG93_9FLAO|nr:RHS repeat-associated core domain-containing protein [Aquimarina spongiae]SHI84537.1 RHS repeat-associated core domain-containing protein [Aquimarina spongiae]
MNIFKKGFALIFLTSISIFLHSQDEGVPTVVPETGFSLENTNLGTINNSINLFTGEVAFPIQLATLSGRNGIGGSVSINYSSSGVFQQSEQINRDAPTGILGLGWNLNIPKIIVDNKQTGTRHDDEFFLVENGSPIKLIRTKGTNLAKEYITEPYNFWKIIYKPNEEKWEITKEDGTIYTYGDKNSGRNTVEWIVKWGNWIGNSSRSSNQSQQGLSFNLSTITNRLGNQTKFTYDNTENKVGTNGKFHTEASYLKKIEDPIGNTINLSYSNKSSNEFEEPHVEIIEPDAYQERYEKKYLSHIIVKDLKNITLKTITLNYILSGTSTMTKRKLSGITYEDRYGASFPSYNFEYDSKSKLKKVITPTGAEIIYTYSTSPITPNYASRNLNITAPTGYAEPTIHHGPDYVVVTWRELNNGNHDTGRRKVKSSVYTWDGYWKKQDLDTYYNIETYDDYTRRKFFVTNQRNFFAISYWSGISSSYYVKIYHKDQKTDSWVARSFTENITYVDDEKNILPKLLSGDNFVAMHTFRDGDIFTYVWNGTGWTRKVINQNGNEFESTATNNWIISHQKGGTDWIKLHYLTDEGNWVTKNMNYPFSSDHDDLSYWYSTPSFALVMADDNPEFIYSWDENYNNVRRHNMFGAMWDRSTVLSRSNALFYIGDSSNLLGKAVRYDGFNFIFSGNNYGGTKGVSISEDFFIHHNNRGNHPNDAKLSEFDPNTLNWKFKDIPYVIQLSRSNTAGNGLYSSYEKIYFRNNIGSWGNPINVPNRSGFYTNEGTGFNYHVQEYNHPSLSSSSRGSNITILKNDTSLRNIWKPNRFFGTHKDTWHSRRINNNNGNIIILAKNNLNFKDQTSLELYYEQNDHIEGKQGHHPVVCVSVNDGVETRHNSFKYTTSYAKIAPNGLSGLYNKVRSVNGSSNPNITPNGYTETYFYTGLSQQIRASQNQNVRKLLVGAPYATLSYDKNGIEVSLNTSKLNTYSKSIARNGGGNYNVTYLRPGTQTTRVNGITSSINRTYDTNTGLIKTQSTTNYGSEQQAEVLKTEYKYYWEHYDTDRSEHLFTPIIQTKSYNGSTVISSIANRWSRQSGQMLPYESYTWKGSGSSNHPFSSTPSATGWLKVSAITKRDSHFNILETKDQEGIYATTIYGYENRLPISSFSNARHSEVLADNFDGNSLYNPQFYWNRNGTGWSITDNNLSYNTGTGEASINPSNAGPSNHYILEFRSYLAQQSSSGWVGVHFAKSSNSSLPSQSGITLRITQNEITLNTTSSVIGSYNVTNETNEWHNYRLVKENSTLSIYRDGIRIIKATNSASGAYWSFYGKGVKSYIDDFRKYPKDAFATSTSYDPVILTTTKTMDSNGLTTHSLTDNGSEVAAISQRGTFAGSLASYYPRSEGISVDASNFITTHNTNTLDEESYYDTFDKPGRWINKDQNNNSTTQWSIVNGELRSTNTGVANNWSSDLYWVNLPKSLSGRVGIEFSIRSKNLPTDWGIGIAAGGNNWKVQNSGTECALWMGMYKNTLRSIPSGPNWSILKTNLSKNRIYRVKIILNTVTNKSEYYIDGKLVLSNLGFRAATDEISKIAFFNYGKSTTIDEYFIDNLVVYQNPIESQQYSDATGKPRQYLTKETENSVLISENGYDNLGRSKFSTLTTRVSGDLSYHPDFVTSSGTTLQGQVKTINGHDYAFTATKYDVSPLSRPVETSSPGSVYRLGSGHNATFGYYNNTYSPVGMGSDFSGPYYNTYEIISPDGAKSYTYSDISGRTIMQKTGTIKQRIEKPINKSHTVLSNQTYSFTPTTTHEATYDFKQFDNATGVLKIGTSPSGSDILSINNSRTGTFTVNKNTTYYVTVSATINEEIYYDHDCETPIIPSPSYCFNEDNCRIPCEVGGIDTQLLSTSENPNPNNNAQGSNNELSFEPFAIIKYIDRIQVTESDVYLTTSYQYDKKGNMTKVFPPNYHNPPSSNVNPNDYITTYTYDHFGRIKTSNTPDGGLTRSIYDTESGRLRFYQDANAIQQNKLLYYKYDALGRPIEEGYYSYAWNENTLQNYADNNANWPSGSPTWRKRYIYGKHDINTSTYGNLTEIHINSDEDSAIEVKEKLISDTYGRITRKEIQLLDQNKNYHFDYKYDNANNIIEEEYGDVVVNYWHDAMGRLQSVGKADDKDYYASYSYDINGVMTSEILNNGSWARNFSYDTNERLTKIEDPYFKELVYYDGGYNNKSYYEGLIARTHIDYKSINTLGSYRDDYWTLYEYDKLGRLITADNQINNTWDIGVVSPISYDSNGNITKTHKNNQTRYYTHNAGTNQVKQVSGIAGQFDYDSNGNITQSGSKNLSLVYDLFHNKVTSIVKPSEYQNTKFTYDGTGERLTKRFEANFLGVEAWEETLYLRGLGDYPLLEIKTNHTGETNVNTIVYGLNGMVAMKKSSNTATDQIYFFSKDHLGSTRVMVRGDGTVTNYYDYDAYGTMIRSQQYEQLSYQYTGQEYDIGLGLHNYRARMYDSDTGIFYGMDPADQYASPYVGIGNNPINLIDPTGAFSVKNFLANNTFLKGAFQLGNIINTFDEYGSDAGWQVVGQYAKSAAIEGAVALATHGVGTAVSSGVASGSISKFGGAAIQAGSHGLINGTASELQGGSFGRGFATGALSSISGSALAGARPGIQFGGAVLTGGLTSHISGGSFIDGAIASGITSGANHLAHELTDPKLKHPTKYKRKNGKSGYVGNTRIIDGKKYYQMADRLGNFYWVDDNWNSLKKPSMFSYLPGGSNFKKTHMYEDGKLLFDVVPDILEQGLEKLMKWPFPIPIYVPYEYKKGSNSPYRKMG